MLLVFGKEEENGMNLRTIFKQLSPKSFFKISRSEIININAIENIENHFKNRLLITFSSLKNKAGINCSTTSNFRKWLGQ